MARIHALRAESDERAARMYAMYRGGATLAEVGSRFGLSRERVRQLLKRSGYEVRSIREAARIRRELDQAAAAERAAEILDRYREVGSLRDVAREFGLTLATVRDIVQAAPAETRRVSELRRKHGSSDKQYTDAELVSFLRTASEAVGGVLSTKAYSAYAVGRRLPDGRRWPTHQVYRLRFGSWREALHGAGLRANPSSPIAGQRLFEQGHCVDAVRHVARELERAPTASDYDRAARASCGALPSLATVRQRCGGWLDALRLAGF